MTAVKTAAEIIAMLRHLAKQGTPSRYCHLGNHFSRFDESCGCYKPTPHETPTISASAPDIDKRVKHVNTRKSRKPS